MNKYEIKGCIGRGNYGNAHLLREIVSGALYVVKRIPIELLAPHEKEQAHQEVDLLAQLHHPNIVSYKESFVENDVLHIVMSYCEGGDLACQIKATASKAVYFDEKQILNWFVQIVLAIQYIHRKHILHRDLKSSNVFLTTNNIIKVGDFGIARVLSSTMDHAKSVVGTPYYMSPEVCENKPYSYASDVWSLGCLLYEMCTFKHAFDASNLLGLVFKIVQEEYSPIPSHYSKDMKNLVDCLLHKDPKCRLTINQIIALPFIRCHTEVSLQENIPYSNSIMGLLKTKYDSYPQEESLSSSQQTTSGKKHNTLSPKYTQKKNTQKKHTQKNNDLGNPTDDEDHFFFPEEDVDCKKSTLKTSPTSITNTKISNEIHQDVYFQKEINPTCFDLRNSWSQHLPSSSNENLIFLPQRSSSPERRSSPGSRRLSTSHSKGRNKTISSTTLDHQWVLPSHQMMEEEEEQDYHPLWVKPSHNNKVTMEEDDGANLNYQDEYSRECDDSLSIAYGRYRPSPSPSISTISTNATTPRNTSTTTPQNTPKSSPTCLFSYTPYFHPTDKEHLVPVMKVSTSPVRNRKRDSQLLQPYSSISMNNKMTNDKIDITNVEEEGSNPCTTHHPMYEDPDEKIKLLPNLEEDYPCVQRTYKGINRRPSLQDQAYAIRHALYTKLGKEDFQQVYNFLKQMRQQHNLHWKNQITGKTKLALYLEVDRLLSFEDMLMSVQP